jgi:hypothetical protein
MTMTSVTETELNRETTREAFGAWQAGTGAITDVVADDAMVIDGAAFHNSLSFNDLWTRVPPPS